MKSNELDHLLNLFSQEFGLFDQLGEDGFLYKTRQGRFDISDSIRFKNLMTEIHLIINKDNYYNVASRIYMIPTLLCYWRNENINRGVDAEIYDQFSSDVFELVRKIMTISI